MPMALLDALLFPFYFLLRWMASNEYFFTTVREGTVKAILRGETFERFVMAYSGHHLDNHWNVVRHAGSDDAHDKRPDLLKKLGLYWVGPVWSHTVGYYKFKWNVMAFDPVTGKERLVPRDELTNFAFVSYFTYAIVTDRAETRNGLQTDLVTTVTILVVNPYLALFATDDWMRRLTAKVNGFITGFVGNESYDGMRSLAKSTGRNDYADGIVALSGELERDYGIVVKAAELQTIDLSGSEGNDLQKAAARKFVAEKEAEATVITATASATADVKAGEARAAVTKLQGNADRDALAARLTALEKDREAGLTLAGYDAMVKSADKAGNTVVWANNPLGALVDVAKKIKGDQS